MKYSFSKKTIKDIDLGDKRVLMRADYNVPLAKDGTIVDDYRLQQSLPTLRYLLEKECPVVIMSHLGRPKGKVDPHLSLAPVAVRLRELLPDVDIGFVDSTIGNEANKAVKSLKPGQLLLLENTRFHPEDELNDPSFAKKLAKHGDIFVQDCFGVAHRRHASVVGIADHLPTVAGLLLEREVAVLEGVAKNPEKPFMAIVGGAKIADKIQALSGFIDSADAVAIVGAMANTFLLALGKEVGSSLVDKQEVDVAKDILNRAAKRQAAGELQLFLPTDVVVSTNIDGDKPTRVVELDSHAYADISSYPKPPDDTMYSIAGDELILDIGPLTATRIAAVAGCMNTVVWSGTAGVAEVSGLAGAAKPFEHGTRIIVDSISRDNGPFTVVGGGDTVSYVESIDGLRDKLGHVSTGGSASVEVLSGNKLPGVEVCQDK